MLWPTRYTLVPWLWPSDLVVGRPERYRVDIGGQVLSAWSVQLFDAPDACMVIRAVKGNGNDGGVITLALAERVPIDWPPPSRPTNVQQNPIRHVSQADGCDGDEDDAKSPDDRYC